MSVVSDPPEVEGRASPRPDAQRRIDRRYRLQQSGVDAAVITTVCLALSVIYALIRPDAFAFLTQANLSNAAVTVTFTGIPALGVGILMIAGEFDLSIGANFVFASIVMAQLYADDGMSVWLAALVALAIGTAVGLINGLITLRLKIPSFITTLGTAGIWEAAILFVHGAAEQPFNPPSSFAHVVTDNIVGVPAAFWWFIVLAIAGWALLQRHRLGNHIFAAGGNRSAAIGTGVRVNRAKYIAFALAGLCAALGGILSAGSLNDVSATTNADLPLQAIAACVIGGVFLMGGRGTILGIVLGSVLLYWIQDVLLLLAAPSFYLTAFVGALVIVAAVLYQFLQSQRT